MLLERSPLDFEAWAVTSIPSLTGGAVRIIDHPCYRIREREHSRTLPRPPRAAIAGESGPEKHRKINAPDSSPGVR